MARRVSNPTRGVQNQPNGGNKRLAALEEELYEELANQKDEVGTGQVNRNHGHPRSQKTHRASLGLMIKQGKRLRDPNQLLNRYAAAVPARSAVTKYYSKALADEHKREQVPDIYKDYNKRNVTAVQMGLVQTAHRNYQKSRQRMRDNRYSGV